MIVVFGITLICVSSSLLPVDDPDTQYDEAETPVNFAYPVSPSTVTLSKVATQIDRATTIPRRQQAVIEHGSTMYVIEGKRLAHASRPRLDLLCALLC